jgi:iron complex outermembrane receptor protein
LLPPWPALPPQAFSRWNVFNEYPDKYVFGNRSSGINPYSFIAPNGASGRLIMGGLHWTF